jgi:hypothetical protein
MLKLAPCKTIHDIPIQNNKWYTNSHRYCTWYTVTTINNCIWYITLLGMCRKDMPCCETVSTSVCERVIDRVRTGWSEGGMSNVIAWWTQYSGGESWSLPRCLYLPCILGIRLLPSVYVSFTGSLSSTENGRIRLEKTQCRSKIETPAATDWFSKVASNYWLHEVELALCLLDDSEREDDRLSTLCHLPTTEHLNNASITQGRHCK